MNSRFAPDDNRLSNREKGNVSAGFLVRIAVSVVLLLWIFNSQASLTSVLATLRSAEIRLLILGFALFACGELLTVWKWQYLLRVTGTRCAFVPLMRAMLIGEFYSMFLPTSVGGDVARIVLTRRATGSTSTAASAALMQRNTGMGGLLMLALIATSIENLRLGVFSGALAWLDYVRTWYALITLAYIVVNVLLLSDRVRSTIWPRLKPLGAKSHAMEQLLGFADSFHGVTAGMARAIPLALFISLTTQFLDCIMGWCAGRAIGADISLTQACIFVPAATLTALLPVSLNGIGVRELAYITLLRAAGLSQEQALAISTIHFGCLLGLALIGGAWQLISPKGVEGRRVAHDAVSR